MNAKCAHAKSVDRQIAQAERIKMRLRLAKLKFIDVDRIYGLPRCTTSDTLRNPNVKGERAIAAALGTRPELLWRDRYHASGQRKSRFKDARLPTMAQRQIGERKSA